MLTRGWYERGDVGFPARLDMADWPAPVMSPFWSDWRIPAKAALAPEFVRCWSGPLHTEFSLRMIFSTADPKMVAPSRPFPMGKPEAKLLPASVYQAKRDASH